METKIEINPNLSNNRESESEEAERGGGWSSWLLTAEARKGQYCFLAVAGCCC